MAVDWSKYESPLNRMKRQTQKAVDKGILKPWVMGDYEARDRHLAAIDRRDSFQLIRGGKLKSACKL